PETPPDISETPAPISEEKPLIPRSPKKLRSNLAKSAVLLVVWIFALIIIRKIFVENNNTTTPAAQFLTNGVEIVTEDQIRSDFVVFSSRDEILDVSAPFSVKIVCTNPIGYRVTQDTLPSTPVSLPAGDQKTYSFEKNLEFLLNHSDGITIYINGEIIRSLYSHPYPVRVSFTTNPTKITVKHYTPIS
ncbi:MAG: hypothetical protein GXO92_06080, partial [FCB group bacterium]|nr:hypothetical protein [FCB group bacterium]